MKIKIIGLTIAVLIAIAAGLVYVRTDEISVDTKSCEVYTFSDTFYRGLGRQCIDKIVVIPIYFVAKDQTSKMQDNWKNNITDIFDHIKPFFESEFDNKINISVKEPMLVYGDNNISSYVGFDMSQEVIRKLGIKLSPEYFTSLTIYYDSPLGAYGGGGRWESNSELNGSVTLNPTFWLDESALCSTTRPNAACYGYISSGHEFGHAIGMSHPWEIEINRDGNGQILDQDFDNIAGDVMSYTPLSSYNFSDPFDGHFLSSKQKQNMMVK